MRLFIIAAAIALLAAPTLVLAGPVDVNTADAETISAELKGIGERTVELNRADIKVSAPKK